MDGQIITHLRAEEADLVKKLGAIRSVLAVYDPAPAAPVSARAKEEAGDDPGTALAREVVRSASRRITTMTEYANGIRSVARQVIQNSTVQPVPTRLIIEELTRRGMEIRGQNPLNAVSALLSRSPEFTAQGRNGWMLTEFEERYGAIPRKENGALNGNTASAPEAGEVAASLTDNLHDEISRLVG